MRLPRLIKRDSGSTQDSWQGKEIAVTGSGIRLVGTFASRQSTAVADDRGKVLWAEQRLPLRAIHPHIHTQCFERFAHRATWHQGTLITGTYPLSTCTEGEGHHQGSGHHMAPSSFEFIDGLPFLQLFVGFQIAVKALHLYIDARQLRVRGRALPVFRYACRTAGRACVHRYRVYACIWSPCIHRRPDGLGWETGL